MKIQRFLSLFILMNLSFMVFGSAINSYDVGLTISKVRTARSAAGTLIVASSFEGTVLGIGYDGKIMWQNKLSGYMNHDLWCEDVTGDGIDEIFAANADGSIYAINADGTDLWRFRPNEAPMYSVCVVHKADVAYVVCGGYDKNIYYLNADGSVKSTLASGTYSVSTWVTGTAPAKTHIPNFIRKWKKPDGSEQLVVCGTNNSMQTNGNVYLFDVLGGLSTSALSVNVGEPVGDMRILDVNDTLKQQIFLGSSSHYQQCAVSRINPAKVSDNKQIMSIGDLKGATNVFGYRVSQMEVIPNGAEKQYLVLSGPFVLLVPVSMDLTKAEILTSPWAYNDMWKDPETGKIILASNQNGGSEIYIVDVTSATWKNEFKTMKSPGKIDAILANTATLKTNLNKFSKPSWERNPIPSYLLYTSVSGVSTTAYKTPVFLNQPWMAKVQDTASWHRMSMENVKYRLKKDTRKTYSLTESAAVSGLTTQFNTNGIAYWGGHGNDPYYYSLETSKKVIDFAPTKMKTLIYPELEDESDDFKWVLNDLFYPMATYGQNKNLKLFIRSKNIFWIGTAHLPLWSRLKSGEFANVFVPAMEETTDKTMDLSLAGRVGMWASGAVDSWGSRAVPDNTSFDRLRQFSSQTLDNHFLRQIVYASACGAQYFDNFTKPEVFETLLAKGALFVPKRSEIVSFSPVHLSMLDPDTHFIEDGTDVKWLTNYSKTFEDANAFVFSRMNGSWPGAATTDWDFSRYAAGVKERRLSFLPSYPNGFVMVTPPQEGKSADLNAVRGKMVDSLNPIYKHILKEYYTDGHYYYSADGSTKYNAKTYYTTIADDIKNSTALLPLTVSGGDVAWVVAQTSPTHLRLTVVDGGYLNPSAKTAKVTFHTASPVKMTDLLDGKTFNVSDPSMVEVDVPCGLFRFIDIELATPLKVSDGLSPVTNTAEKGNVNLFPNPFKDHLNVNISGKDSYDTLEIFDVTGRVVCFKSLINSNNFQLNSEIACLKSGIYTLKLAGNYSAITQKIVKQ